VPGHGPIVIRDLGRLDDLVVEPLRAGLVIALMCACARVQRCHRRDLAKHAAALLPGLRVELDGPTGVPISSARRRCRATPWC